MTLEIVTMRAVSIEVAPQVQAYRGADAEPSWEWTTDAAALPARWLAALDDLCAAVDTSECAGCGCAVGWVLHEDDERPHSSGLRWHAAGLAQVVSAGLDAVTSAEATAAELDDAPIVAMCGECIGVVADVEPLGVSS